jgi:hypothetical protein
MLRKRPSSSLQIEIPAQPPVKTSPPSQPPLTSRSRREEILREFKERIKEEEEEEQKYAGSRGFACHIFEGLYLEGFCLIAICEIEFEYIKLL